MIECDIVLSLNSARAFLFIGLVISLLLAGVVASAVDTNVPVFSSLAMLWAVPFVFFALGLSRYGGAWGGLARWLAAGWLAGLAGGAGGNRTRVLERRSRSSPGAVRAVAFLGPGAPTDRSPTGSATKVSRSALVARAGRQAS